MRGLRDNFWIRGIWFRVCLFSVSGIRSGFRVHPVYGLGLIWKFEISIWDNGIEGLRCVCTGFRVFA